MLFHTFRFQVFFSHFIRFQSYLLVWTVQVSFRFLNFHCTFDLICSFEVEHNLINFSTLLNDTEKLFLLSLLKFLLFLLTAFEHISKLQHKSCSYVNIDVVFQQDACCYDSFATILPSVNLHSYKLKVIGSEHIIYSFEEKYVFLVRNTAFPDA